MKKYWYFNEIELFFYINVLLVSTVGYCRCQLFMISDFLEEFSG